MIKAGIALLLAASVAACAAPSGPRTVIDTARSPVGRDMQADLSQCRAVAEASGTDVVMANGLLGHSINTAIRSMMYGLISPYSVASIATRTTTAAVNSENRKVHLTNACMRRAGWRVY